jgi:2-pyrone-4,6-dicarboxylate lactonase
MNAPEGQAYQVQECFTHGYKCLHPHIKKILIKSNTYYFPCSPAPAWCRALQKVPWRRCARCDKALHKKTKVVKIRSTQPEPTIMSEPASQPPVCAAPRRDTLKPSFTLPPNAADCHAHVFGERDKYGYAAERQYTPPPVYLKDYLAMHDAVGIARGVVVQTAVHGTHNQVIVDAIAQSHGRLRGIALLREDVSDDELDALERAGVRGFRANLVAKIGVQFDAAKKLAARVARLGWHAQFLLDIENFPDFDRIAAEFPCDMVIDHMGRPDVVKGVGAPGFQALIRALKSGRVWSKLSAPYRTSRAPIPYDDITPFARALVAAAPGQLVFGTDWPHVMMEGEMPNTGTLVERLVVWVPDEATRTRILVDNPARLYRF